MKIEMCDICGKEMEEDTKKYIIKVKERKKNSRIRMWNVFSKILLG